LSRPESGRLLRWRRGVGLAVGVGYPVSLLLTWLALRFSGDGWWGFLAAQYAPPVGFLFPAPLALFITWRWAARRWLVLQLVAVLFSLFSLLGLNLGFGRDRAAAADSSAIRLVSFNIHEGVRGVPGIVAQVMKMQPNLVLLQEAMADIEVPLREAFAGWHVDRRDQFFIASRFPIREVRQPAPLHYRVGEGGGTREGDGGAHFMAYTIDSSLGPIDVFNVHTTSPREGLEDMRGRGFLYELRHGRILFGQNASTLTYNAFRRRRQLEGVAAAAHISDHPVLVAGDFNVPGLSRLTDDMLGNFDDAFIRAGRGFGNTYPSKLPFLRIDRVFTGHGLRAVEFQVGDGRASDHLCVGAVLILPSR
jgi:vancomycin resistance protein VanJ